MKNLANCNPIEFLTQTNKIRKATQNWLSLTKIMEIRKNVPEFDTDTTKEERREAVAKQAKKNMNAILNSILEEYPVETAELLGLMFFVEPENIQNHQMSEFFSGLNELLECQEIIGFFTSLTQLAQMGISASAKAPA